MTKTVSKIAYLDGIRGVAAFLVFFHHFLLAFYPAYFNADPNATNLKGWDIKYGQSLFSVLSNGHFCVCIFFVLSGYVLSRKYFLTNQFEVVVSGVQRRFLRLYIPVASTIILSFIMFKAGLFYNMPASKLTHSEWWLGGQWILPEPWERLWISLKFSTMFQGDAAFDTSLWTMAIEFTGSLFVFAFLAFTHNTRNRLFTLFLVFLYCKFSDNSNMMTFVFGISLNYIAEAAAHFRKHIVTVIALLMLALSLVIGAYPSTGVTKDTPFANLPDSVTRYSAWFHAVGAYLLVMSFVISEPLQRFISLRPFRFLGYISFSLYLLHPLIIGSFSSFLFLKWYITPGYNHAVLYIFILSTILCLFVSWLMTRYIDDRGVRFTQYMYRRWIRKPDLLHQQPNTGE